MPHQRIYDWATDLHILGSFEKATLLDLALEQLDELSRWNNGLRQSAIEELVYVADVFGHAMPLKGRHRLADAFSILGVSTPFETSETPRDVALAITETIDPVVLEELRILLEKP